MRQIHPGCEDPGVAGDSTKDSGIGVIHLALNRLTPPESAGDHSTPIGGWYMVGCLFQLQWLEHLPVNEPIQRNSCHRLDQKSEKQCVEVAVDWLSTGFADQVLGKELVNCTRPRTSPLE
jgi:hypothetical protein